MKAFLIFLGLAVATVSAHNVGLRVRFDVGLSIGQSFFYDVPRTLSAAMRAGFKPIDRPEGPYSSLVLYCLPDRIVCVLFDDIGYVAGLQVALPQDEFTDAALDMTIQGYVEWQPSTTDGTSRKYWAKQQYFVNEEYLARSAEDRAANYDSSKLLQLDAVWLSGFHGQLDRVSSQASDVADSVYTRQNCIVWMGRHYFYNMTEETPCENDALYPWFVLVHSGDTIGTGMLTYGKMPAKDGERDWFERPNSLVVQGIAPGTPDCLHKLADNPGMVTIHIYYINEPWGLGCLFN